MDLSRVPFTLTIHLPISFALSLLPWSAPWLDHYGIYLQESSWSFFLLLPGYLHSVSKALCLLFCSCSHQGVFFCASSVLTGLSSVFELGTGRSQAWHILSSWMGHFSVATSPAEFPLFPSLWFVCLSYLSLLAFSGGVLSLELLEHKVPTRTCLRWTSSFSSLRSIVCSFSVDLSSFSLSII